MVRPSPVLTSSSSHPHARAGPEQDPAAAPDTNYLIYGENQKSEIFQTSSSSAVLLVIHCKDL